MKTTFFILFYIYIKKLLKLFSSLENGFPLLKIKNCFPLLRIENCFFIKQYGSDECFY